MRMQGDHRRAAPRAAGMREQARIVTIASIQRGKEAMTFIRSAVVAATLAATCAYAQASPFTCIAGSANDCTLATSNLSWMWDGVDFTIINSGGGYVSEVYFDIGAGMVASFLGGTGTVNFYANANPGSLPDGDSVGFVSDRSFDSDPRNLLWGIDSGETATFRITGAAADSFDIGSLAAGLHVRSLIDGGTSLVTAHAVPEPQAWAMTLLGLGIATWASRRKKS
jgi:hypothetical protein